MHPLIKILVITIYIDHKHISLLKGKEKILHKLLCENGSFFSYLSFAFWLPAVQHEHEQFFFILPLLVPNKTGRPKYYCFPLKFYSGMTYFTRQLNG